MRKRTHPCFWVRSAFLSREIHIFAGVSEEFLRNEKKPGQKKQNRVYLIKTKGGTRHEKLMSSCIAVVQLALEKCKKNPARIEYNI